MTPIQVGLFRRTVLNMLTPRTFTYKGWVPNVETFPSGEVAKGVIVFMGIATILYIAVCVVGAFFTGGQSLWGLLPII